MNKMARERRVADGAVLQHGSLRAQRSATHALDPEQWTVTPLEQQTLRMLMWLEGKNVPEADRKHLVEQVNEAILAVERALTATVSLQASTRRGVADDQPRQQRGTGARRRPPDNYARERWLLQHVKPLEGDMLDLLRRNQVRQAADQHDLVAQVKATLWEMEGDLTGIENPRQFILTLLLNTARDWVRSQKRASIDHGVNVDDIGSDLAGPEYSVHCLDGWLCVRKAMGKMSPQQYAAFVLRVFCNYSNAQINELAGGQPRFAANNLQRAYEWVNKALITNGQHRIARR